MSMFAIVDKEGRPFAWLIGNFKVEDWSNMEAASLSELQRSIEIREIDAKEEKE